MPFMFHRLASFFRYRISISMGRNIRPRCATYFLHHPTAINRVGKGSLRGGPVPLESSKVFSQRIGATLEKPSVKAGRRHVRCKEQGKDCNPQYSFFSSNTTLFTSTYGELLVLNSERGRLRGCLFVEDPLLTCLHAESVRAAR